MSALGSLYSYAYGLRIKEIHFSARLRAGKGFTLRWATLFYRLLSPIAMYEKNVLEIRMQHKKRLAVPEQYVFSSPYAYRRKMNVLVLLKTT